MLQIISILFRIVLAVVCIASAVMGLVNTIRSWNALIRAANTRNAGVSFLTAFAFHNLMFNRQLYSAERSKWVREYWRSLARVGLFVICCLLSGLALKLWHD